jgi:FixJ family two-component response regulator
MTDVIMPGIQGPELVKAGLEMRPQMRVIYVSGYTDRGLEMANINSKAVFLRKPYSLVDLARQIRSAAASPGVSANS